MVGFSNEERNIWSSNKTVSFMIKLTDMFKIFFSLSPVTVNFKVYKKL